MAAPVDWRKNAVPPGSHPDEDIYVSVSGQSEQLVSESLSTNVATKSVGGISQADLQLARDSVAPYPLGIRSDVPIGIAQGPSLSPELMARILGNPLPQTEFKSAFKEKAYAEFAKKGAFTGVVTWRNPDDCKSLEICLFPRANYSQQEIQAKILNTMISFYGTHWAKVAYEQYQGEDTLEDKIDAMEQFAITYHGHEFQYKVRHVKE